MLIWDFPGSLVVKTPPYNEGYAGLIPGCGVKTPHALQPKNQNIEEGSSLVVWWLRLHDSNTQGPSLIPGHQTRYHMPQLRVHMLQLKILHDTRKSKDPACSN